MSVSTPPTILVELIVLGTPQAANRRDINLLIVSLSILTARSDSIEWVDDHCR